MTNQSVGFIGGGRVARIFLEGWKRQNALPANIVASDCQAEALAKLQAAFPSVKAAPGTPAAAAGQDIVFLAVHPPALAGAAEAIKAHLKPNALVVSLAPKFTTAKLVELLGGFGRVARVIPNAASVIGAGYNPVAFAAGLPVDAKSALTTLLAPLGESPEVAEDKLEAYAVLTAMGPTYLWFQLQTLREVAAGFGLAGLRVFDIGDRPVADRPRRRRRPLDDVLYSGIRDKSSVPHGRAVDGAT